MEEIDIDSQDEYEYEYDEVETEVGFASNRDTRLHIDLSLRSGQEFYVDVDLSSLNPEIRSSDPAAPKPVTPAKRKVDESTSGRPDRDEAHLDSADHAANGPRTPLQEPQQTPARNTDSDPDALLHFPSRVQILDLPSINPIISYQGQVFSCTWTDMVGTNMFFTQPGMSEDAETLRSTADYDLLGTSRIKLVGHKPKMTKKGAVEPEVSGDIATRQQIKTNDNQSDQDPRDRLREKQASFLEKLKEIKRQRGEPGIDEAPVNQDSAETDQNETQESHEAASSNENLLE